VTPYRRYAVRHPGDLAALAAVLDAATGRVVVDVEPDPSGSGAARALVALLAGRSGDDVVVASFDWYALALARDAGLRTAFRTPRGVALSAALAYAIEAGHAECHPHASAVLAEPGAVEAARAAGIAVVPLDDD
jgi:hypothetical protein